MKSDYQLIIIGAGAAGIGAARAAQQSNIDYVVLEAAHRVGGRGFTEELAPGVPWDVGCHWLHSGSINPLARVADELGFSYDKSVNSREFYLGTEWLSQEQKTDYKHFTDKYWEKMFNARAQNADKAIIDYIDQDSKWAPYTCYWQSLMTSEDVDMVSALDLTTYDDTDENWPLYAGYGALLEAAANNLNVQFNSAVQAVNYENADVKVTTARGTLRAKQLVVTVSNGILAARDITFTPDLPVEKKECIDALPLGCYNNLGLLYEKDPFGPDAPERIDYSDGNEVNLALKLKPCNLPYVYVAVAGRTARWLEKQPASASEDYLLNALCDIFGNNIRGSFSRFRHSAWGTDPYVKGSYSASKPGYAHFRQSMGDSIANRIFFAGEATSQRAFATAHGAFETGIHAIEEVLSVQS